MTESKSVPSLSVVLPCYNEASGLNELVERYRVAGQRHDFELVLVDNGSSDGSASIIAGLAAQHAFVSPITVTQNQGYGHGIWQGLCAASGEFLAWSHADMQTDPADVFKAYDLMMAQPEREQCLIKGARHGRRLVDQVATVGMQWVATILLRASMREINAQPKLFHRNLLKNLSDSPKDFSFDLYVLYQSRLQGMRVVEFPVQFLPRKHGLSHSAPNLRAKIRTSIRTFTCIWRLAFKSNAS